MSGVPSFAIEQMPELKHFNTLVVWRFGIMTACAWVGRVVSGHRLRAARAAAASTPRGAPLAAHWWAAD